jgi:hypothetical protein
MTATIAAIKAALRLYRGTITPNPVRPGLAGYRDAGACWLGLPVDALRIGLILISICNCIIGVNTDTFKIKVALK